MKEIICIIPIRSKSKGIKNKNIKKIFDIPLCMYVLSVAIKSKLFEKIIIACDSDKYFKIISFYLKKLQLNQKNVFFFKRSKKSATNNAKTELVLDEIIKQNKNYKYCYLLQATSPLLLKKDIIKSFDTMIKKNLDSLFSAYPTQKFLWVKKKNFLSLNYDYKNRPMRQKKEKNYIETGAIYAFKIKGFIKYKNRIFGKIGVFEIPEKRSVDIDEKKDLNDVINYISKNIHKYSLNISKNFYN